MTKRAAAGSPTTARRAFCTTRVRPIRRSSNSTGRRPTTAITGEDVRLRLLAELLQIKVTDEIREKLGASYSPVARSFTSSIYPGYGYIQISTNVATGDVEQGLRCRDAYRSGAFRAVADAGAAAPPFADRR